MPFGTCGLVLRMAEQESVKYGAIAQFIAMYYDERRRKSWHERSKRSDPQLLDLTALLKECMVIDEQILVAARTQISKRLDKAGLQVGNAQMSQSPMADPVSESLAAKEAAATAAAQRRSHEVARAMAKQQEDFLAKQTAMQNSYGSYGGDNSGQGYPVGPDGQVQLGFRRQAKRAQFMEEVYANKQAKWESGKGKGKGGKGKGGNGKCQGTAPPSPAGCWNSWHVVATSVELTWEPRV